MAPAREPGSPTIIDITNANIAAEAERQRLEEEKRRKAEENAAKGMDPSGRKLKAKDRPDDPNAPKPRQLIPEGSAAQTKLTTNPVSFVRAALRNDGKEGGWAVLKEPLRAVDAGLTRIVEGTGETVIWAGLSAYSATEKAIKKVTGAALPALPKSWDPLEKEYREIQFNSMSSENRPSTTAGQLGSEILSFALTTFAVARRLPQLGMSARMAPKGSGLVKRAAAAGLTGIPAGAAADFLLTKAGDPNVANIIQDLPFVTPETEELWSLGLASNRTDNAFISKLKATVTGGAVGAAADAIGYLLFARKATQGFLKQGLPPEEAMARGVAAGAEEAKAAKTVKTDLSDKQWPVATTGRLRELETRRIELENELAELNLRTVGKPLTPALKKELDSLQPTDPSLKTPEAVPETSPELQAAEQRLKELTSRPDPDETEFEAVAAEVDRLTAEQAAKAEPDAPPLKDDVVQQEAKRMEEINQQLADIYDEKAQLEMDLSSDPANLRAEDQATFDESVPPNVAAADQIRLETSVPKVARRPDADPAILKGATSPTMGKSPSVFTDAFYKIISTAPDVNKATIKTLRSIVNEMDLRNISKAAGRSVNEILTDASEFIDTFRAAVKVAGDDYAPTGAEVMQLLRDRKALRTITDDGVTQELLNAKGVVATKTIITDTTNQIYALAQSLDELYAAGRNPGNQMDRIVDRLVTLSELHKLSGYDSGYNLRMFQEMIDGKPGRQAPKATPAQKKAADTKQLKDWATKIHKLSRAGQDAEATQELQALVRSLVLNGGDPAGTLRQVDVMMRVGWQQAMNNLYNSILSGPITQLRNTAGNLYSTFEKPLSLALSGSPQARYAAQAAFRGLLESYGDAFEIMRVSFRTGEPLQLNRKFMLEEAKSKAHLEALRLLAKNQPPATTAAKKFEQTGEEIALGVIDTLYTAQNNQIFNWGSRALVAGDDFFKVINSRMKVSMDAAYAAFDSGLSPKQLDERFSEIYTQKVKASFHDDWQIKDEALLDFADASTFQDNPGGVINGLSNLIEKAPILRLAMPFVRTPYNLAVYGVQHLPLLNRRSSRARAVLNSMPGDPGFDPVAKAIMQGRQATGALFLGAGVLGAFTGNITGNGPPAGPARDLWLQEHRPRSVKVAGKWVSYESIEPINNLMAVMADVAMLGRMGHVDVAEQFVGQIGFALAISIVDKSYLSGLTVVAGFLDPKTYASPNPVAKGLFSTANNLLPMAGARRAMANTLNPYMREIDGELQKVMAAAMPGFAMNEPTKIDPFTGKPFTSLAGGWYNALSPFRIYDAEFPKGTPEALGQSVAANLSDAGFDSSTLTTKLDQGEDIAKDERADFATALHEVKLAERLDELFNSPGYQDALRGWKSRQSSLPIERSEHLRQIQSTINQAKAEARARMMQTSVKWMDRSDQVRKLQDQMGRGDIDAATQTQQAIDDLKDGN
jgi:hypothetical protein